MWNSIANIILRNRLLILSILLSLTLVLGYFGTKVTLQYEFGKLLPSNDETFLAYEDFKQNFGSDGMVVVIAVNDKDFYNHKKFNAWRHLGDSLSSLKISYPQDGEIIKKNIVDSIFSEAHLYNISKDRINKKFVLEEVVHSFPIDSATVDSVHKVILSLPFYRDIVYKESTDLHLMMLFINKEVFNSKNRGTLIDDIHDIALSYENQFSSFHFSGLPFIRSVTMNKVKAELRLFVLLALFVTSILLFLFFRSLKVVLISVIVVVIGVVWSFGIIGMFNYEITILMGLIPPLIIVIGIPNCVYLINKYQQEYRSHGNKAKSLTRVIKKVGNATFLTNVTTAMGFGTFIFTHSDLMKEFGVVASVNIICVFFLSILLVPIMYSYLPAPKTKHTKHLDRNWLYKAVDLLVYFATEKRRQVYLITAIGLIIGFYGMSRMHTTGNIVDDLPDGDQVVLDLKFFEKELNGVMPFEIVLSSNDTIYKSFSNISKIQKLQQALKQEKYLSPSLSIVDAMKFISQAYANGKESKFNLDFSKEKDRNHFSRVIGSKYFKNTFLNNESDGDNGFVGSFIDSTHHRTRITLQIADIGTAAMDSLILRLDSTISQILNPLSIKYERIIKGEGDSIHTKLFELYNNSSTLKYRVQSKLMTESNQDEFILFPEDSNQIYDSYGIENFESAIEENISNQNISTIVTGTGVVYTKGTTYLVKNLFISLIIAICVIAVLMSFLFKSWRMVLVSLLPNLVPLIFTSALMGYFGIPIKPSTILVFSIAFGISIDDTIHFLAKYRQELQSNGSNIRKAVVNSIKETGTSMIYTSIILFFGFSIFIASNFGGTQALGTLVSLTLFVAMLANLVLLPALLLSLEKALTTKQFKDSEAFFEDDQDIDWKEL
ncbi:MAG: efflux RND transporter permease subunit [Flavobacteriales bacterium]|nr:efflux RND transporter permease subunit [Flavobacteriales bacterium]